MHEVDPPDSELQPDHDDDGTPPDAGDRWAAMPGQVDSLAQQLRCWFGPVLEVCSVVVLAVLLPVLLGVAAGYLFPVAERHAFLLEQTDEDAAGEELVAAVAEQWHGWQVSVDTLEGNRQELVLAGSGWNESDEQRLRELAGRFGFTVQDAPESEPTLAGGVAAATTRPGFAALLLGFQALVFGVLGVILRRLRCLKEQLPVALGMVGQLRWGITYGVLALIGSFALSVVARSLGLRPVEQPWLVDLTGSGGAGMLVVLLFAVLVVPLSEELLFRGYVFERLRQGTGEVMAYVISAVLFAAIHGNPSALVIYLYLGLLLAAAYHHTGTVVAPALAHTVNNAVAFGLLVVSR